MNLLDEPIAYLSRTLQTDPLPFIYPSTAFPRSPFRLKRDSEPTAINDHKFLEVLISLVEEYGHIESPDPTSIYRKYVDDKITILGILRLDDKGWAYKEFHILLKLPSPEQIKRSFGVESKNVEGTYVYYAEVRYTPRLGEPFLFARYYRPGEWGAYINHLWKAALSKQAAVQDLDGISIDDAGLFADIDY